MKGLLIGAVIIGAIVGQLAAQGLNAMETAGAAYFPAYAPRTVVALPVGYAVPTLVISNPLRWGQSSGSPAGRHGDSGYHDWGYASDPFFYPENYGDAYPVLTSAIVAMPVMQKADAPPPPTPARPQMLEYHWPSSDSGSSATTYSIVSKDGRVLLAAAVWVKDNALCYYTPDHSTGRIRIDSIDRQATRQRNGQQQLNLWLPPERQTDLSLTSDGH
jgi:hypothetical protein